MKRFKLIVIGPSELYEMSLHGLCAIGGSQASGKLLKNLKYKDDYVIVSPQKDFVSVHVLKGKQRGEQVHLSNMQHLQIQDLLILVMPMSDTVLLDMDEEQVNFQATMLELAENLAIKSDLQSSLQLMLGCVLHLFSMNKGLVITKDRDSKFELKVQQGLDADESWLSESLISTVIQSRKPIVLQNVLGSKYEKSKSLIATGFLSVLAWPLVVRGECLGVLLVGSNKPHSGLSDNQKKQAKIISLIASLVLYFFLKDQESEELMSTLKQSSLLYECPILTSDRALQDTCDLAKQIAPTDISTFIYGETGVGKEVMAKWIHQQSERSKHAFVAVNCGAIPSELLESTLFGHMKGAFTGANANQTGKFQLANGGTLFLDEIADLPEKLQVKLLRVLQEKTVEAVGSNQPTKINVRVISASHKSLVRLVEQGSFREDLFYRLAEIHLEIPPLRERPTDIILLANYFLKLENKEKSFSSSAWSWIKGQSWRGNVRELMSAIKRACVLSHFTEITRDDFLKGMPIRNNRNCSKPWLGAENLEMAKQTFLREKVKKALELSEGKRTKAAELLGVTPRTMFRYLEDIKHNNETNLS